MMSGKPDSHVPKTVVCEDGSSTRSTLGVIPSSGDPPPADLDFAKLLPTSVFSPTEVATSLTDGFVQKLQFDKQCNSVARRVLACINSFHKFSIESEKLAKALNEGIVPNNCKVGVPFQPKERIEKGAACVALQKEIAAFRKQANSESAALFRRGQRLNVDALRDEFVECIAKALPVFARFALAECDVDKTGQYKNHDLVADYLIQHQHQDPLLRIMYLSNRSNPLIPFLQVYRQVNSITQPLESVNKVFDRYFPKVAEGEEPKKSAPDTADPSMKSVITDPLAIADKTGTDAAKSTDGDGKGGAEGAASNEILTRPETEEETDKETDTDKHSERDNSTPAAGDNHSNPNAQSSQQQPTIQRTFTTYPLNRSSAEKK